MNKLFNTPLRKILISLFSVLLITTVVLVLVHNSKRYVNFIIEDTIYHQEVIKKNKVKLPNNPIKNGHYFFNWYLDEDFNIPFDKDNVPNNKEKVINAYARFNKSSYKITFNNANVSPIILQFDSEINLPSPSMLGYVFGGWYLDKDFKNEFNLTHMPNHDITLYAKWIRSDEVVTITFVLADEVITKEYQILSTIDFNNIYPNDDITITNLYLDESYTTLLDSLVVTKKLTVYVCGYTNNISFVLNDDQTTYGVKMISSSIDFVVIPHIYNDKPVTTLLENSFKDVSITSIYLPSSITNISQHAFLNSNITNSLIIPSSVTNISSEAFSGLDTQYLIFKGISSKLEGFADLFLEGCEAIVIYELEEITITVVNTIDNSKNYSIITTPLQTITLTYQELPGYTFKGAYLNSDDGYISLDYFTISSINIYLDYETNSYEVTFVTPYESITKSFKYLEEIIVPENLNIENYKIDGWFSDSDYKTLIENLITPSGNINIYAKYYHKALVFEKLENSYSVKYDKSQITTLKNVTIPLSYQGLIVDEISSYGFSDISLNELTIPVTINKINEYAFSKLELATPLIINDHVKTILDYAFKDANIPYVYFSNLDGPIDSFSLNFDSDVNFDLVYPLKVVTISFENTFSKIIDPISGYSYSEFNEDIPTCELDEYIFNGWFIKDTNILYDFSKFPANNLILVPNMVSIYGSLTIIVSGETFYIEGVYDTIVTLPEEMNKTGYLLDGFYSDTSYKIPINITKFSLGHNTVYAQYYQEGLVFSLVLDSYYEVSTDNITYKDIVIPNTYKGLYVKQISSYAFNNLDITSIILPNNLEIIGDYAFCDNERLTSINLPKTVIQIGSYAFTKTSIDSLVISSSIKVIKPNAFSDNLVFMTIYFEGISDKLDTFLDGFLDNLFGIAIFLEREIVITFISENNTIFEIRQKVLTLIDPSIIPTPEKEGFNFIHFETNNKTVYDFNQMMYMPYENLVLYAFFEEKTFEVTFIIDGEETKVSAKYLHDVIIPEFIKDGFVLDGFYSDFDQTIFYDTTNFKMPLNGITLYATFITAQLLYILEDTGYSVKASSTFMLTNLIIPPRYLGIEVTKILDQGFKNTNITSVNLNNVKIIGDEAFYNCTSLTFLDTKYVESIGRYAFYGCSLLQTVNISNSVTSVKEGAFSNLTNLKNLTIGNSLEIISEKMFHNNTSITNIILGSNVLEIKEYAFSNNTLLSTFTTNDKLQIIRSNAFENNSTLGFIHLSDSLHTIESEAFLNNINLLNIRLPQSLINLGNNVFKGCIKLNEVLVEGKTEKIPTFNDNFLGDSTANVYYLFKTVFLTFYVDGEIYDVLEVRILSSFKDLIVDPIKKGHTFNRWVNISNEEVNMQVCPVIDSSFYAVFTINTYKIYFDFSNYNLTQDYLEFKYNEEIVIDLIHFDGYSLEYLLYNQEVFNLTFMIDMDITLTAVFKIYTKNMEFTLIDNAYEVSLGLATDSSIIIPSVYKNLNVTTIKSFSNSNIKEIEIPEGILHIESFAFANTPLLTNILLPASIVSVKIDSFSYMNNNQTIYFKGKTREFTISNPTQTNANVYYLEDTYEVEVILDGGIGESMLVYKIFENVVFPTPTKTGYRFTHYTFNDGSVVPSPYTITSRITIYANYEIDEYTITFVLEYDGLVLHTLDPITKKPNTILEEPVLPNILGYSFIGWYLEPTFETIYIFDRVEERHLTLYAKFEYYTKELQFLLVNNSYYSVYLTTPISSEIIIPNIYQKKPVKEIKESGFRLLPVTKIVLPQSVSIINSSAFEGCSSLVSINLENVVEIHSSAFKSTKLLSDLDFSSLTYLGSEAFLNSEGLVEVYIPSTIDIIERDVFSNTINLEYIYINLDIPKSGFDTFFLRGYNGHVWWLQKEYTIYFNTYTSSYIEPLKLKPYSIITKPEEIPLKDSDEFSYSFYGWYTDNTFTTLFEFGGQMIGEDITLHAMYDKYTSSLTFEYDQINNHYIVSGINNSNLVEIFIPNYFNNIPVKEIKEHSFNNVSTTIEVVHLSKSIEIINSYAFSSLSSLTTITNTFNVKEIGDFAFSYTKITEFDLSNVSKLGIGVFHYASLFESTILSDNILVIPSYTFANTSLNSIIITNNVETIEEYAFSQTKVQSVILPSSVKEIKEGAFSRISTLNLVIMPKILHIGSNAFSYSSNITYLDLGDSLITIGESAFYELDSLQYLLIPSTVEYIAQRAFANMQINQTIILNANNISNFSPFYNSSTSATFIYHMSIMLVLYVLDEDYQIINYENLNQINKEGFSTVYKDYFGNEIDITTITSSMILYVSYKEVEESEIEE